MQKKLEELELAQNKLLKPKDTVFVFLGTDYLFLDFQSDTWNIGDVQQNQGYSAFSIPENSAVVPIDFEKHPCDHTNFIVTGGCVPSGELMSSVFGCIYD
jgi:hypothetical protein